MQADGYLPRGDGIERGIEFRSADMIGKVNCFDELETVIGTVADGQGGRTNVVVTEFGSNGHTRFAMKVERRGGGHPDAGRFSTQVKRAKFIYADPSNKAEWNV